jgi:ABC-type branched-subunit amino acid transport system permease subunit
MGQIIHTSILVGGGLIALFGILLAWPSLRLREVIAPLVEWLFNRRP